MKMMSTIESKIKLKMPSGKWAAGQIGKEMSLIFNMFKYANPLKRAGLRLVEPKKYQTQIKNKIKRSQIKNERNWNKTHTRRTQQAKRVCVCVLDICWYSSGSPAERERVGRWMGETLASEIHSNETKWNEFNWDDDEDKAGNEDANEAKIMPMKSKK